MFKSNYKIKSSLFKVSNRLFPRAIFNIQYWKHCVRKQNSKSDAQVINYRRLSMFLGFLCQCHFLTKKVTHFQAENQGWRAVFVLGYFGISVCTNSCA